MTQRPYQLGNNPAPRGKSGSQRGGRQSTQPVPAAAGRSGLSGPSLRPYRRECLVRLRARYREGKRRVLVSLPTGTGKTVVFASFRNFFRVKRRTLVIAHRQELLDQATEKFRTAAPELTVGIEQGRAMPPTMRELCSPR